ncbi:hypothetical protein NE865_12739 [Phthorimaea operculella]|nr:hypothetical protein NE865_12739 [Phthorimaea operculella]
MGRKSKRKKGNDGGEVSEGEDPAMSDDAGDDDVDKYKIYKTENYIRQYPEDGGEFEYIVIYESADDKTPIGERDLMGLGSALKLSNKGIKQLKRINRYKIAVIFERPGLANAALNNLKSQKELKLRATIPARLTEVTGVITNVPTYMSNKKIYDGISSCRNVVSVRRFMRRSKDDEGNSCLVPTQAVSITFASAVLPDYVDINSWYFEVRPYTPPVSQCLRCLRFGHIGKFCKNAQRCSICGDSHNYKDCVKRPEEAVCVHCKGKHVAIAKSCPVKIQKAEEIKVQMRRASYSEVFNNKNFPPLKSKVDPVQQLFKSEQFMNLLISSIIKIISASKDAENPIPISTQSIKSALLDSFSINKTTDHKTK